MSTLILIFFLNSPTGLFYSACDAYTSNRLNDAERHARAALLMKLPERYERVLTLMVEDIEDIRKSPLRQIGSMMRDVTHRLDRPDGGEITRRKQDDIVKALDRLIEDAEGNKKGTADASASPMPLPAAQLPNDPPGAGNVDPLPLRRIAANWGQLPPEAREKVKRELEARVPPKYHELIEEYTKRLNK